MITALSAAALLSDIKSPSGDKYIVTEAMLNDALQCIYAKEHTALVHLSDVRISTPSTSKRGIMI
eukprot:2344106-Prorocentrum_lima.AAC.1